MMKLLAMVALGLTITSISYANDALNGNWSGQVSYTSADGATHQQDAEASFLVKGKRVVGFYKAWNGENLPCIGYFDPNNENKIILKTWYDDRPFKRMELHISQDGNYIRGGTYTFEKQDSDISLTKL